MNEFTMAHPDIVNYLAGGLFLGLFYLVIYTWQTSWRQQNKINENQNKINESILHRLEALDKETDIKIEKIKDEVKKADYLHEQIRISEKESLHRENKSMEQLIHRLKELTDKISKLEIQKS